MYWQGVVLPCTSPYGQKTQLFQLENSDDWLYFYRTPITHEMFAITLHKQVKVSSSVCIYIFIDLSFVSVCTKANKACVIFMRHMYFYAVYFIVMHRCRYFCQYQPFLVILDWYRLWF